MRIDYTRTIKLCQSMFQAGIKSSKKLLQSGCVFVESSTKRIAPSVALFLDAGIKSSKKLLQSGRVFVESSTKRIAPSVAPYLDAGIKSSKKLLQSGRVFVGSSAKTRIISSVSLFLAVCAFGAAAVVPMSPDVSDLPIRSIAEEIKLPNLDEQIASLAAKKQYFMREERVRPGDTLGSLLTRLGIDDAAAVAFIKSDNTARAVLQLKAGKLMQAKTDESGALYWLSTAVSETRDGPAKDIVVSRAENGFTASAVGSDLERRIEMRAGYINSSLFAATDAAQIPDAVTSKFVDMFSTNVDFRSDLRRGDHFNLVYETFWQNGSYVRAGRILAAEFANSGKTYQAVWFEDENSSQGGGYYTFDGKSLKRAFLKSPLEFTRISSGFSMRVHPLTGAWKQHKGIDFAAPTGTPIRAAADGTVEFVGNRGGYGNFIVVKHWKPYSTAYGHMSRFANGIRNGSKVRQGDVIGYVGTTGWATGPHLHYEFRVNTVQQNPLNIDMPNARPLAANELQQFRVVAADMEHRFALLNPGIDKVAME